MSKRTKLYTGVKASFVARFGEAEARRLEVAAEKHNNDVHNNKGTDPFKWVLLICIGYECFTKDRYREYHGILTPSDDIKRWARDHAELDSHDGDCDYLSIFCGTYAEYVLSTPVARTCFDCKATGL